MQYMTLYSFIISTFMYKLYKLFNFKTTDKEKAHNLSNFLNFLQETEIFDHSMAQP